MISSLNPEDRVKYDYDLLEEKYVENQNNEVDDESTLETLTNFLKDKEVLLVAPGKSSIDELDKVKAYIKEHNPVVIGVNAILKQYSYDYVFLMSKVRYDYAKESYKDIFNSTKRSYYLM